MIVVISAKDTDKYTLTLVPQSLLGENRAWSTLFHMHESSYCLPALNMHPKNAGDCMFILKGLHGQISCMREVCVSQALFSPNRACGMYEASVLIMLRHRRGLNMGGRIHHGATYSDTLNLYLMWTMYGLIKNDLCLEMVSSKWSKWIEMLPYSSLRADSF